MPDSDPKPKSRDVEADLFIEATAEHQVKHNHLLAIAVDYYQDDDIPNLNNCANDIEGNTQRDGLIQLLTKYYFFNKENIRFLRSRNAYGGKSRKDLKEEELSAIAAAEKEAKGYAFVGEATHRTIIAQLKELARNITPEDNLIICYSGHGIYDQDFDEGYWIPSDGIRGDNASYIENGTIRTALNAIKSHHTVLFSDSCYSGTLFSVGQTRSLEAPRVYQKPSRWGITAGRKEPVSDGALGENSPFARELLRILEQRREVWIGDMINEIIKNIEDKNDKQTPVGEALSFIRGHDNGQFVFLPKLAREIDYWRIAWRENTRKGYFAFLARYPDGEYEETALEALNVFAAGKTPGFSEAALETFDFLDEAVPVQAKAYLGSFIRGETRAVLSPTAIQMYRELMAHFPGFAQNELKSFILLGENFSNLPVWEEAYAHLEDDTGSKVAFFRDRFAGRFRDNPYRGFDPYWEPDSKVFFGRKAVIRELADRLEKTNLLVISAAPYAGKTSVVRAGLYPLLKEREGYEWLEMPPGVAWSNYRHRARILSRIQPDKKQLLLIDPYEDLFADGFDKEERFNYEKELWTLCENKALSSLKIIICLRSNFEGRLRSSDFGTYLWKDWPEEHFFYRLPGMTGEELREVIVGPMWSRLYGYESDALPERILAEVQNRPNALALLSFALQRLYDRADENNRVISEQQYEKLGGVRDALNKVAEEKLYGEVSPGEERALRRIFLRMVEPIAGGNYGSRMVWVEEITCPNEDQNEVVHALFHRLGKHEDLFTVVEDEGKPLGLKPRDLLVSSWSRYRRWIDEFGQENIALQRSLWEASIKKKEELNARAIAGGYSNYWDNNPNLPRILHHVLETGTELLLEDDKNELNRSIEDLQQELSGNEQRRFQELMTKWKEEGKPEYLDEFIMTGASGRLLEIFLQQPTHWLNQREAKFIQKSWEKRSEDITSLYRQIDQANVAKKEAESRQEQIVKLLEKAAIQTQAFKAKYQSQTRKDLLLIQQGFRPNLHLILVGINDYQGEIRPLKNCVQHARRLSEVFSSQEGKLYNRVHTYLLTDEMATKNNILSRVDDVGRKAGVFDFVIMFISGHGAEYILDANQEGIDGKDGLFLPYDYEAGQFPLHSEKNSTALSGQELCTRLMHFQSKVILILDIPGGATFLSTLISANRSDDLNLLTHNVFGISGTSPGESVKENTAGSIFSLALTESFTGAKADLDSNGVIYADELLIHLVRTMRSHGADQNVFHIFPPTITNIPLFQIGDDFSLPSKEITFSGDIEDDGVIEGIMTLFYKMADTEGDNPFFPDRGEIHRMFQQADYEGIIAHLNRDLK